VSEVEVRLTFRGPDEILMGLPEVTGSRSRKAGDRVHTAATVLQDSSGWSVHSGRPTSDPLEAHVASVVSLLDAHQQALESAASHCLVELSVAVYFEGDGPDLTLNPSQIAWLAGLGASLDVDLYPWLPDRPAEGT